MSFEPLKTYAPVVSDVVEHSRLAESDLEAKDQAEDQFYFIGDFKKFIDQVNSARKSMHTMERHHILRTTTEALGSAVDF